MSALRVRMVPNSAWGMTGMGSEGTSDTSCRMTPLPSRADSRPSRCPKGVQSVQMSISGLRSGQMDRLDRVSDGKRVRCQPVAPATAFLHLTALGHTLQRLGAEVIVEIASLSDFRRGLLAFFERLPDGPSSVT